MKTAPEVISVEFLRPEGAQVICGQAHFQVLTIEDLYKAVATGAPNGRFGLACSEASGARIVRKAGNDETLVDCAVQNVVALGCGHCFVVVLADAYPVQVLGNIRLLPSVVAIFCATGNPATAIVARLATGGALLGVSDGDAPLRVEDQDDVATRQHLVRRLGYLEPISLGKAKEF